MQRKKFRLNFQKKIKLGQFDGMTYEEIEEKFPEEFERRTTDKLAYRYPR
jgi:6-phosphofructo-2-kinase